MIRILKIFFCLLACSQVQAQENLTITKELPNSLTEEKSMSYYLLKAISNKLKFEEFDNGFDSLALRLWFKIDGGIKYEECIEVTYQNKKWNGKYYITEHVDDDGAKVLKLIKSFNVVPNNGWQNFKSEILKLDVSTIPTSNETSIKLFDPETGDTTITMILHGRSYLLEIGSIDKYRLCEYYNPVSWQKHFPELNNVVDLLILFRQEFNVLQEKKWRKKLKYTPQD